MSGNYKDPILQVISDLKIALNKSNDELLLARNLLNSQNESMIKMQEEIKVLTVENERLRFEKN